MSMALWALPTLNVPKYMEDKEVIRRDLADFYGSVNYVDEHFGRILGMRLYLPRNMIQLKQN